MFTLTDTSMKFSGVCVVFCAEMTLMFRVAKLNLLEMNLLALEKPTKELQLLLTQCRNDLTISQAKLKDAESSLANAETLLKIAQVSFKRLEDRFEVEREEALKREREAYKKGWLNGFCAGAIGTAILANYKK